MVPLKKKKQGHIFNRNKKQTCISINPFQGPRFLSYRQAELLQEPALGLHLVHAAQQCSGSHLSTCSTASLKSFQVPKSTLWRERKVPQSLPSSHNFDLGPTASAHATFSSATSVYSLGTFRDFLSPCLCSWYFLQLQSHLSSALPTKACQKKCILSSKFSSDTTPSKEPSRALGPYTHSGGPEPPPLSTHCLTRQARKWFLFPAVTLAPCQARMAPCFSL